MRRAVTRRHPAVGEHRARALHVHDGLEHARAQARLGRRFRRRAQPRPPRDAGDGSGAAQARQPHLQRAHGRRHRGHRRGRVDVRGQRHDVERAGLLPPDGQPRLRVRLHTRRSAPAARERGGRESHRSRAPQQQHRSRPDRDRRLLQHTRRVAHPLPRALA
eukprot:scaffold53794_cov67-Phaeocystis_antarctica.AAC.2